MQRSTRAAVLAACCVAGGAAGFGQAAPFDARLFDRLDANDDGLVAVDEVPAEHRPIFDRLVRIGDRDGDGRLSAAEFAAALRPTLPDKPLDEAPTAELPGADHARLLLLKLDTDRDQTLTRGEAPTELREAFDQIVERADRNQDGTVSRFELNRAGPQLIRIGRRLARRLDWQVEAELIVLERQQGEAVYRFDEPIGPMEALADPQRARELFNQMDADGDGKLQMSEVPEGLRARERFERLFRRADADRNGVLTRREYLTAAERLSQFLSRVGAADADKKRAGAEQSPPADAGEAPTPPDSVAERLIRRMVRRADRNGDGRITRSEAQGRLARRFDKADANADGELDAAELDAEARKLDARLREVDQSQSRKRAG